MAKIEYSALVNRIKGRVSHSVLSNWKGMGIIKRHNSGVHQPRSAAQQAVRGLLNDLSGEFYSLTTIQKELWQAYASALPTALTPLNAYVKLNQVVQKYLPGTARSTSPPPSPSTPEHIQGFTVYALAAADFCIQWTGPSVGTDIAVFDYWPMPGYDNTIAPRFTFGVSADCTDLCVALATTYPTGTVMRFRGRTIDTLGRTSPWTNILGATAL